MPLTAAKRFYRGLCTRHPKRLILFIVSLSMGLALWNSFTFSTGQLHLRDVQDDGEFAHHHEVPDIMNHFSKIEDSDSIFVFENNLSNEVGSNTNSALEAAQKCWDQGEQCVAYSYQAGHSPLVVFKPGIHLIVKSKDTTLYVKKEHVHKIRLNDEMDVCAVPLNNLDTPLINNKGCNIPDLDPFDQSIIEFVHPQKPLECEGTLYTRFVNGKLSVKKSFLKDNKPIVDIKYSTLRRPLYSDDNFESDSSKTLPLDGREVDTENDFVSVNIQLKSFMEQTDYHASVYPIKDVMKRKSTASIPLNIIILGFDGTSEGNFRRLLPNAYKFLKDDLEAVFFKGYSIVGEATTPALTALLTGRSVEQNCEDHEARTGYDNAESLDEWPFIFKDMKKKGYATMFSEDAPTIGAFSLRLEGFTQQPSDHYGRPFWWSVPGPNQYTHTNCINAQAQHNVQLDYLKSFLDAYPNQPKFGFTFLASLCHQELNTLSIASEDIYNFLRTLSNENYLNNTMLVLMGDHGARFEGIRGTLQGKLEERLPFLSIVLPKWFKQNHPNFLRHMKENTEVILSPFDLHATFMDLLQYPQKLSRKSNSYGISLFRKIPKLRRCKDAGIPEHFCPCVVWHQISTEHLHVKIAASNAVHFINSKLSEHGIRNQCEKLSLKRIVSAVQEMPSAKVQTFKTIKDGIGLGVGEPVFAEGFVQRECNYQIQFETVPGNGLFEASVKTVNGNFIVYGEISRINRYGSQPHCIEKTHPYMRKFCLCKR